MIVDGKFVQYDLSRFSKCKLKRASICDLMQIPDFVRVLNAEREFDITDTWIVRVVSDLVIALRIAPDEKARLDDETIKQRRRWQSMATNALKCERKLGVVNERIGGMENEIQSSD